MSHPKHWLLHLRYSLRSIRLRIRFLVRKEAVDRDLDEELQFHLAQNIQKNLRAGMSLREARRQAHITFGGVDRFKEQVREAMGIRPLEELAQDLRYTLRQLRRAPLFTSVAIATLAIGIGANTGIFSVVNGLLLRERPYRSADELVRVYSAVEGESAYSTSYALDLQDLRTLDDVFQEVGAFRGTASRVMEPNGARMVLVETITANLIPLLGMGMSLGRTFSPEEDDPAGAQPVVILGHTFWLNRFGGDFDVLGQDIRVAGRPYTIVGVTPEEFESFTAQGFRTDLLVPMSLLEAVSGEEGIERTPSIRGALGAKVIARLRPGVTLDQAQVRTDGLALALQERHPDLYEGRSFNLYPARSVALQPDLDAYLKGVAALLMGAVGLVLLLACTNLTSFLLARGVDRKREIALRLALGARRGRLIRQLLTETLVLGLLGSVGGLLLARWSLDLLSAFRPPISLPLNIDYRVDGKVLLFTLGVTILAGLLAGLAPALQSTNPDVAPTLKDGAGEGAKPRIGLRSALVALQMSVSVVLLVTGGLFVRSLQAARKVDPGFDTGEAGLVWVDLAVSGVPQAEWESVAQDLALRARALPGIEAVGASNGLHLSEGSWTATFRIPDLEPPPGQDSHRVLYYSVDHAFLKIMGIPLAEGRGVTELDRAGTQPVVVVSESAARRFWPDGNPLGREIFPADGQQGFRVVGVARDAKVLNLRETSEPLFYFPRSQYQRRGSQLWLIARGAVGESETVSALTRLVRETNPDLVIVQAKTMTDHLALVFFLPRVSAVLLGSFALLALTLATVGLYGVVSHAVSRRTREVGIRMALGADRASVIRMVVRDAMGVVVIGGTVGFLAALAVARLFGQHLIGVGPYDLVTLAGVPFLLLTVATLASLLPARRASSVNPVRALRTE
jgi:predicted permease